MDQTLHRRIDQLEQLLQLGETDEALDRIVQLLDVAQQTGQRVPGRSASRPLGAVLVGDGRFISLGEYCQRRMARLPPAVRARYRRQVDSVAEAWYSRGIADRDEPLLRRLVDWMFCSQWGDNGLLALGEMALERADYQQARIDWSRIPTALPAASGSAPLGRIPAHLLAYPDTELDQALVWARLALVSIRAHQFTRARIEIDQLRGAYPTARGTLGGKEGIYAQRLDQLLEAARHEPSRSVSDDGFLLSPGTTPPAPVVARPRAATLRQLGIVSLAREVVTPGPILAGRALCFCDSTFPDAGSSSRSGVRVNRLQLAQGRSTPMGQPTTMFTFAQAGDRRVEDKVGAQEAPTVYLAGDSDRCVWATQLVPRQLATDPRVATGRVAKPGMVSHGKRGWPLVGLDLRRDGAVCFRQWPPDARWTFSGPPRVSRGPEDGRRVLVAMTEQGVARRIYVACYQADSGRLLWRRALCDVPVARQGEPELAARMQESPVVLTVDGSVVYCNTNRGVVAALRIRDGQLRWLVSYPREVASRTGASSGNLARAKYRRPNACLFHQGLLLLAPTDSHELLALDAASGARIWSWRVPFPAVKVLGTMGDKLILVGDRLWAIDIVSGELVDGWGVKTVGWGQQEETAGEGVIAGQTIYWPWDGKIWALDGATGWPTALKFASADEPAGQEQPASLPRRTRLLIAGDRLIAAGPCRITVYRVVPGGSNGREAHGASADADAGSR